MPYNLPDSCSDNWCWNKRDKSHEVKVFGKRNQSVLFHPNWSNGTAAVRGNDALNNGRHYWEIDVSQRIFGTSMMFGVGTKRARLHVDAFVNLLGENEESWGLSHKGLLWNRGESKIYTKPFRENEPTTIGILFDGVQGTLSYFKDGETLGVAFEGFKKIKEDIFPIISSTAAKTEMTLIRSRRSYTSLQDRCRAVIIAHVKDEKLLEKLYLPNRLIEFIREATS
ncbi:SPRY domain-containing SOCS box protein 3-like [Saccoglossus kowalevskii]|uniref:SPRY domain-containing SOCS box protein 3 n=1 Tax=Saccoglossus kowalevskii TaxID=10224 RepID=A0ABM0GUF1_SACKO|nr:PREDICTED: SPRY domain-containing SOCS box protein 3-like [Saccoglossus kowalevskii]